MIEFDDRTGLPAISISSNNVVMLTTVDESVPVTTANAEVDPVVAGKYKAIPWFDGNNFPQAADLTISKTPVLKRALNDLTRVTLGQGLFPCEITDTLPSGQEVLKMINDPAITGQLQSYWLRRYLAKTQYDVNAYGNGFVQFILNIEGTKIMKLNPVNALHCRLEMYDTKGDINNLLVSGYWPDSADDKNTKPYILLNEIDPYKNLIQLRDEGKLKKQTVFMHVKNSFSSNDFYALPNWTSAEDWIKITQKVPKIINAGMDNVLNIFFWIKIPMSYWEWKFPANEFENEKERRAAITAAVTKLETEFTSVENAKKALITFFGYEEGNDEKWEIEIMQPKFSQENFVTSSAADTQIAIASGYSADLLGLMYGNSKGGSMQRELLLLQYALSWESRQQLADPVEMMLKFNGAPEGLTLRFKNTFLTTLDTGAGTATTLS